MARLVCRVVVEGESTIQGNPGPLLEPRKDAQAMHWAIAPVIAKARSNRPTPTPTFHHHSFLLLSPLFTTAAQHLNSILRVNCTASMCTHTVYRLVQQVMRETCSEACSSMSTFFWKQKRRAGITTGSVWTEVLVGFFAVGISLNRSRAPFPPPWLTCSSTVDDIFGCF